MLRFRCWNYNDTQSLMLRMLHPWAIMLFPLRVRRDRTNTPKVSPQSETIFLPAPSCRGHLARSPYTTQGSPLDTPLKLPVSFPHMSLIVPRPHVPHISALGSNDTPGTHTHHACIRDLEGAPFVCARFSRSQHATGPPRLNGAARLRFFWFGVLDKGFPWTGFRAV